MEYNQLKEIPAQNSFKTFFFLLHVSFKISPIQNVQKLNKASV